MKAGTVRLSVLVTRFVSRRQSDFAVWERVFTTVISRRSRWHISKRAKRGLVHRRVILNIGEGNSLERILAVLSLSLASYPGLPLGLVLACIRLLSKQEVGLHGDTLNSFLINSLFTNLLGSPFFTCTVKELFHDSNHNNQRRSTVYMPSVSQYYSLTFTSTTLILLRSTTASRKLGCKTCMRLEFLQRKHVKAE